MKIESVPVSGIVVGRRQRAADPAKVQEIAASIERVGLLQPITVYTPDDATVELVAGLHRLEAVRSLGWDEIDAAFVTGDATAREMAEIAENLHRSELTALERDEHIARWIELAEIKQQVTVSTQLVSKPPGGRPEGGIRAAAKELGINREAARRAKKTAGLSSEAKQAARETGLDDNRTALLEAARASTPHAQAATLHHRAAAGEIPERRKPDLAALTANWNRTMKPLLDRADHGTRLQFMASLAIEIETWSGDETPVDLRPIAPRADQVRDLRIREESREGRTPTDNVAASPKPLRQQSTPCGQPAGTPTHPHIKDAGPIPPFLDRRAKALK